MSYGDVDRYIETLRTGEKLEVGVSSLCFTSAHLTRMSLMCFTSAAHSCVRLHTA
jgi:hypothetical protein